MKLVQTICLILSRFFPISHTAPTISSSGTPFTQGHLGSLSKCDWGRLKDGTVGLWVVWAVVGVEGVKTDTRRRKERQSELERLRACPQAALEKIDRLINLSELTGFKKMFTFPNEAVWRSTVRNENTGFKIWTNEEEAGEETDRKWGRKVLVQILLQPTSLLWFSRDHRWFSGVLNLSPLLSVFTKM